MIVFFGIVAVIVVLLVLLDFMAMSNDPTPSQYSMGTAVFGGLMIAVGAIGAGCVLAFG